MVALVTGAARGIGYETARLLCERGARVALVDVDSQATAHAARTPRRQKDAASVAWPG